MEEFRLIENCKYHYISNYGNVKTVDRVVMTKGGWTQKFYGKILTNNRNKYRKNYESVIICEKEYGVYKNCKVHQLVAKAFPEICGEWFEGCEIDHINGVTTDNRAENLRVTDKKGNMNNPITKVNCSNAWTDERRKEASERMKKNNPVKQEGYWTDERRRKNGNSLINNHKRSKPVKQYDLDGNFIKEYPSLSEVQRQTGFSGSNIARCCKGKQITSYNYKWEYA